MKKSLLTATVVFGVILSLFAFAPEKMTYQAIVRDSNGQLVTNKQISMRISILRGSASGNAVYVETQTPTTNANGLIAIEVGEGTVLTGQFSKINWSDAPYFMKTEVDPNGGTNYTISGTSQLLSVPYALHSKSAVYLSEPAVTPAIAARGQKLSVSFSGGDKYEFSQGTSTCPTLSPNAHLRIQQGSTTTIFPADINAVNSNRFDALFDIPSYVPVGNYDVILNPNTSCPVVLPGALKVN